MSDFSPIRHDSRAEGPNLLPQERKARCLTTKSLIVDPTSVLGGSTGPLRITLQEYARQHISPVCDP